MPNVNAECEMQNTKYSIRNVKWEMGLANYPTNCYILTDTESMTLCSPELLLSYINAECEMSNTQC